MICEWLEIPFDIATCIVYAFIVITFILLGVYIIVKRDCFHPFFSILLASFVISYGLCDFFSLSILTLNLLGVPDGVSVQYMHRFEDIFYIYASPCAVAILIERIVASCRPLDYEHSRPWSFILLAQALCVLIPVAIVSSEYWAALNDLQQWCLTLVVLLVVNWVRTQREIGSGNLRCRYQMAENINALRLIISIVLADALVTLVDLVFEMVYSVNVVFDRKMCALPQYTVLFVTSKAIRIILELAIPASIVVLHPSVRKTAVARYCCTSASRWNPKELIRIKECAWEENSIKAVNG
ncbi:hypothetical protein OESDEN_07288 [Oesophagostomum dentatum]|uniref:G-protein coupled receptors family 1 profile domain-containing protein n=1 Tax=Oesophagostomum dentatum TaxID=61180 RepID=A0A0B1TBU1_OESDE|nr:hypothetical protein OESDEN_07288 [Oesophagostomum dentatum]